MPHIRVFFFQDMCNNSCKCYACHNNSAAVDDRQLAVENLLNKKPDCFKPKVCDEILQSDEIFQTCVFYKYFFFGGRRLQSFRATAADLDVWRNTARASMRTNDVQMRVNALIAKIVKKKNKLCSLCTSFRKVSFFFVY